MWPPAGPRRDPAGDLGYVCPVDGRRAATPEPSFVPGSLPPSGGGSLLESAEAQSMESAKARSPLGFGVAIQRADEVSMEQTRLVTTPGLLRRWARRAFLAATPAGIAGAFCTVIACVSGGNDEKPGSCGDGVVGWFEDESGTAIFEECDDGNETPLDGCSGCRKEVCIDGLCRHPGIDGECRGSGHCLDRCNTGTGECGLSRKGGPCDVDEDCEPGSPCAPGTKTCGLREDGEDCKVDGDCKHSSCHPERLTCGLDANGSFCGSSAWCELGYCRAGICTEWKGVGERCTSSDECRRSCGRGRVDSGQDVCVGEAGDYCSGVGCFDDKCEHGCPGSCGNIPAPGCFGNCYRGSQCI